MISFLRRSLPSHAWLCVSLCVVQFSGSPATAQLVKLTKAELVATSEASIGDITRQESNKLIINDRWGPDRMGPWGRLNVEANPGFSETVILPLFGNTVTEDAPAFASTSLHVRPTGLILSTGFSASSSPIDWFTGWSSGGVGGKVTLRIDEAFDGTVGLEKCCGNDFFSASLKTVDGKQVWTMTAPEFPIPVFWNGSPLGDSNSHVSVPVRFEVGEYLLEYGHGPVPRAGFVGGSSGQFWIAKGGLAPTLGDIDGDGVYSTFDIDLLTQTANMQHDHPLLDLNADQKVTSEDRTIWVEQYAKTYFGDSTLDGRFDQQDLIAIFNTGHYDNRVARDSGWAEGDWNGDDDFDASDLVLAFQAGGYDRGPRSPVMPIPEPATGGLLIAGLLCLSFRRRAHNNRMGVDQLR